MGNRYYPIGDKVFTVNGRKYTNKHGIADIFVKAVTFDEYTRGDAKYSNSDMNKPAKAVVLEREHSDEIITDVSEVFARLRGHGLHAVLERHATRNGIAEERLYMDIGDIKITTKPDHYDGDTFELSDYKSTSVYSFLLGSKPEWERQLNIGAHFLRHYGFKVEKLTIHAMLYDWSRNEAARNADYIQSPFHSPSIPLWPAEKVEQFMRERLTVLEIAEVALKEGGPLPTCTPDERWEKPTTWALIKKGNKRAAKVCATPDQAEAYKEGHKDGGKMEIVERRGQANRCAMYCDASPWCEQFKQDSEA